MPATSSGANKLFAFALILLCFVFLYCSEYLILEHGKETGTFESTIINEPISQQTYTAGTSLSSLIGKSKCLQSDEEIDHLISQAKNHATIIAMPAKAAGTSLKNFVGKCTKSLLDNFLNSQQDIIDSLLTGGVDGLHPPKIIASHMYSAAPLTKLVTNVPSEVLLIYVHRNERERLVSAIKYVIKSRPLEFCNVRYNNTTSACVLTEEKLIQPIRRRYHEIGFSQANTLTCEVYEAIERNAPNMIFMSFEEADRLQRLLANHHCPDFDHPMHSNVDGKKGNHPQVQIQEHPEEVLVDLKEWVNLKADFISLAFELQNQDGCQAQGISREMEKKLQECPTRMMKVPNFVY